MRRNYLVQNRIGVGILILLDAFSSFVSLLKQRHKRVRVPLLDASSNVKILICHLAHMGDVVIATAFVAHLKQCYPKSQIGMLVGSWSQPVIQNSPFVEDIHVLDHWKLNRSSLSLIKKVGRYIQQRRLVIRQIQTGCYDIAIDLYPYFPNAIPILWKARVPICIGYTSGGFGPLLTHFLDWSDRDQGITDDFAQLLGFLGKEIPKGLKPVLPSVSVDKMLKLKDRAYCVFHMGAGLANKEWPEKKWKEVLNHFADQGFDVVFTGKGADQKEAIQRVIHGNNRAIDLSNTLSWQEFVCVIQHAQLLVTVDSVSGHIASAFEVPTVSLFTGMDRLSKWKPVNSRLEVLTRKVPCAPCFKKKGCPTMECIRDIEPQEVIEAAHTLISTRKSI